VLTPRLEEKSVHYLSQWKADVTDSFLLSGIIKVTKVHKLCSRKNRKSKKDGKHRRKFVKV
jgi:hypothetical protein